MRGLRDGDEIPDFPWLQRYLRVPGARFVQTPSYTLVAEAIEEVCEDFGMTVVYGDPGNGKTFAVRVALAERSILPVTWITPPNSANPRMLVELLLRELGGDPKRTERRVNLDPLVELLQTPRLIVIDEAQRLSDKGVDTLRHFNDLPSTNVAFVIAGGDQCLKVLSSDSQLDRRCPIKTEFLRLDQDEVLDYMPRYHPIYEQIDPAELRYIDGRYGAGNLGRWTNTTKGLCRRMRQLKLQIDGTDGPPTRDVIDHLLFRMGAL